MCYKAGFEKSINNICVSLGADKIEMEELIDQIMIEFAESVSSWNFIDTLIVLFIISLSLNQIRLTKHTYQ